MPHMVPRYYQKIKESVFADDYELDNATIREIEKLFQDYATTKGWDSEARADAGRHAKREIEALATTLEKLPGQWQAVFYNHYLQQYIIEAYFGRTEIQEVERAVRTALAKKTIEGAREAHAAATPVNECMNKLSDLGAEFQRLMDAVNAVKSMETWDSDAFPRFSSGRPTDTAGEKLIAGLDALATTMPNPPQSKNDFIEGALNIIGLQFAPRRTPGARTRKTLRNKRSMSRK